MELATLGSRGAGAVSRCCCTGDDSARRHRGDPWVDFRSARLGATTGQRAAAKGQIRNWRIICRDRPRAGPPHDACRRAVPSAVRAVAADRRRRPAEFRRTRACDAGADRFRVGADHRRIRARHRRLHPRDRGTAGARLPLSRHRAEPRFVRELAARIPAADLRPRQRGRSDADPRGARHRCDRRDRVRTALGHAADLVAGARCSPPSTGRWRRAACS